MANIYTVNTLTTIDIPTDIGLLDNVSSFPPSSNNFLTITPNVGQNIMAAGFKVGNAVTPMSMSLCGVGDSQTQWPSKIEWKVQNPYTSGMPFYKIVFQDSDNLVNDVNFTASSTNQVFVWIYFGVTETVPITSQSNLSVFVDIDFDQDIITRTETLPRTHSDNTVGGINTFNI